MFHQMFYIARMLMEWRLLPSPKGDIIHKSLDGKIPSDGFFSINTRNDSLERTIIALCLEGIFIVPRRRSCYENCGTLRERRGKVNSATFIPVEHLQRLKFTGAKMNLSIFTILPISFLSFSLVSSLVNISRPEKQKNTNFCHRNLLDHFSSLFEEAREFILDFRIPELRFMQKCVKWNIRCLLTLISLILELKL